MSETVNLPALGESVTEGTVTRWLKAVGDSVEVDEPLLEVSTDKVDTEIPSPIAGVIEEILVAEDETAEVGEALVRIGDGSGSGEQMDDGGSAANQEAPSAQAAEEAPAEEAPAPEAPAESSDSGAESGSGEGTDVTLPALGESVTEGTVTRWLKAVGDDVEVDEPLLEVSTDKVDTEIPSPVAGKLLEIRVNEDDTAEVGAVLAVIGSGAAAPAKAEPKEAEPVAAASNDEREAPAAEPKKEEAPAPKQEEKKPESKAEAPKQEAPKQDAPAASESEGTYVTPLVRKLANQHGVDLSTVKGSGVAGRIRKQDVLEAAEAKKAAESKPAAAPAASPASSSSSSDKAAPAQISEASAKLRGTTVKAPRIRQTIARRMVESLQVSAQLTQVQEVDMTRIAKLRASAKESFAAQNGAKLTFLPFIAKAVTEALKQHPKLNASYDSEAQQITYHDAEHLAIAVDTEKGLLVPVINDAGDLNIAGLAKRIGDVGSRTKNGKIGPDELSGGTFTITNIGSVGALFDTPIINQPQVGILGTGAIVKRPVVLTDAEGNDTIAIRSMMYLSLSYDHRLVDGADAGRFLQTLKARLEEGNFSADLGL